MPSYAGRRPNNIRRTADIAASVGHDPNGDPLVFEANRGRDRSHIATETAGTRRPLLRLIGTRRSGRREPLRRCLDDQTSALHVGV
jgi:hypothetical protein